MFDPQTRRKPMNPYLGGALAGLLVVLSVYGAGKFFGASTTFVRVAGYLESTVIAERVASMPYFLKELPKVDWQMMFVAGIFLGAFLSSLLGNSFRLLPVPDTFAARFGRSAGQRGIVAFLGGILAMFGARLADGCPSGHGLSGTLQLAASGFIALVCFFVGGLIMAKILYSGR